MAPLLHKCLFVGRALIPQPHCFYQSLMLKHVLAEFLQPGNVLHDIPLARHLYDVLSKRNFVIEANVSLSLSPLNWTDIISLPLSGGKVPEAIPLTATDARFRKVLVKGIRKYPTNDYCYCLDFADKTGHPTSSIIMGVNGVGKTSIYGALEMIGMGQMKTAEIHNLTAKEYINNLFTSNAKLSGKILSAQGPYELDVAKPRVNCVPAFFASEFDIRKLETAVDLGEFLYKQLGVEDFYHLIRLLKDTISKMNLDGDAMSQLRGDIKAIRNEIRILRLIVERRMDSIASSGSQPFSLESVPLFPTLCDGNNLVPEAASVLESYAHAVQQSEENSFLVDKQFHDLSFSQYSNQLTSLKECIVSLLDTPRLDTVNKIKDIVKKINDGIDKLNKEREKFIEELNANVKKYEDTGYDCLNDLLEKQSQYANKKTEFDNSLTYNTLASLNERGKFYGQLEVILDTLKSKFDALMEEWIHDFIQPVMETLLGDYLIDDQASIVIAYESENNQISATLNIPAAKTDEGNPDSGLIPPKAFFNTFRLKMFAVSLKIACACCAKKIYNANWPVIIDDVFNSSDFDNRIRLGDYISNIFKIYRRLKSVGRMPLQLILFTQDDVIANSVFNGLRANNEGAKLMRLHDYRSFSEREIDVDSSGNWFINIAIEVDEYYKNPNIPDNLESDQIADALAEQEEQQEQEEQEEQKEQQEQPDQEQDQEGQNNQSNQDDEEANTPSLL